MAVDGCKAKKAVRGLKQECAMVKLSVIRGEPPVEIYCTDEMIPRFSFSEYVLVPQPKTASNLSIGPCLGIAVAGEEGRGVYLGHFFRAHESKKFRSMAEEVRGSGNPGELEVVLTGMSLGTIRIGIEDVEKQRNAVMAYLRSQGFKKITPVFLPKETGASMLVKTVPLEVAVYIS